MKILYGFLVADIVAEQMLPGGGVASAEELREHIVVDMVAIVSLDLIVVLVVAFADIHQHHLLHRLLLLLVFSHSSPIAK